MRRSIPPGCVARRLNSQLFALPAPCHAGASTPENVNLFLREPLVNLRVPTPPSKKPFPRRGIVYFVFLPERQKYPDDPVNPVKIILGNLFLPKY
jgi:hypothetical protein